MFFLPLLALLGGARAQNATATDIAVIEANFQNAQLTPQLIDTFEPEGVLSASFSGSNLEIGSAMAQSAVSASPALTIQAGPDAADVSASNTYTVMMVDADIVGTDESTTNQTRHWLVNGAKLTSGDAGWTVGYDGATSVTDYAGPGPAEGSGPHRYVIIVYNQPSDFSPPADLSQAGVGLAPFSFMNYVADSNLGPLIAATYFTVENGQATVSVAATSAVDTATISAASTTASGSASASPASGSGSVSNSASHSGSASASAASSAAASSTPGAAHRDSVGMGAVVGAVGVVGAIFGAGLGL